MPGDQLGTLDEITVCHDHRPTWMHLQELLPNIAMSDRTAWPIFPDEAAKIS